MRWEDAMRSSRDMTDQELERLFTLDGAPGPARALDARAEAAIVAAALSGAGFAPAGPGGGGGGGGAGGAGAAAGGGAMKLAIVGGVAVITAAAIATWIMMRRPREETIETSARHAVTPPPPATPTPAPGPAVAPSAPGPVVIDTPIIVPVDKPRPAHHVAAPARPEPATAPVPEAPPAPKAPADLLAEANAARAAHAWAKADQLYAQVAALPNPLAAETALVADGELRLEHLGDARGAIARFRAALAQAPSGALAEDARWGLAEAERARGDAAAEKRALDDFLAHHADSPLADRARARRKELGP
jgi:hypothetical protein